MNQASQLILEPGPLIIATQEDMIQTKWLTIIERAFDLESHKGPAFF
jgi:hypothetical protein